MSRKGSRGESGVRTAGGGGIRILIAEDDPATRRGLAGILDAEPGLAVVAIAGDSGSAVREAERNRPDVALVDVRMPGGGEAAARGILAASPHTRVVALSALDERSAVLGMLRAGATAYLVKGADVEEVITTLRRAAEGLGNLSPAVVGGVIGDLLEALERAEQATADLREADRVRNELVQLVSDELMNPLTVIEGFAHTVGARGGALPAGTLTELAEGVARAAGRIRRGIRNLLTAAQLFEGHATLGQTTIRATDLIARASSELALEGERLRLPDPEASRDVLTGDPDLATRALVLVLENALGVSGPGDPVEVGVTTRGDQVTVTVADRGPGIPAHLEKRIFELFVQGDSSTTRTHGGLGIGLALVQEIMRAHGGSVGFAARRGGGTVFSLSFPRLERPPG